MLFVVCCLLFVTTNHQPPTTEVLFVVCNNQRTINNQPSTTLPLREATSCLRVRQSPYPYGKPLRVYVTETAFLGGWTHQLPTTIDK
ncbi:hypothetical protein CEN39_23825 [Fischerella thermalis CCMEE 5201]|nr:hypothetical protein CEN39_23825 [Fischerella thermalis CCMEE 5201]